MGKYPAVDVRSGSADLIPALVDDFGPTAIEERPDAIRVFFAEARLRDAAQAALSGAKYDARPVEVDDEEWARRSQESLTPVTVGRLTIAPPWAAPGTQHGTQHPALGTAPGTKHPAPGTIVIQPSMGFGTGHHATTRLCLRALQAFDLTDRFVLDVGTGSGVLALAAVRLGAAGALGIDNDPDAVAAARENLALNPAAQGVDFQLADLSDARLPRADVVTANLTGALLVRSAGLLAGLLRPAGTLILSGLLEAERDDVVRAYGEAGSQRTRPPAGHGLVDPPVPSPCVVWEEHEDGWVAVGLCCN